MPWCGLFPPCLLGPSQSLWLWSPDIPATCSYLNDYLVHPSLVSPNPVAGMFAVLYTAPRPPLGVALLGLLITTFSLTLRLLPYIVFCSMIVLSVWISSSPVEPEPVYYPFLDRSNHIYPVPTTNVSPTDKIRPLELNASLRILIFLLAVPVTSILENIIFRPARDLFVQTVEFWYDLRYVQAAQLTGSWPATCIPILNALRSFQFLADLIDGAAGIEKGGSI